MMKKGFTLVEVMVSVSIFALVMLIATGSVFSIVEANKKTHALKSVMTNINFALESMARDIRVGSKYRCISSSSDSGTTPLDCASGDVVFSFKANRDVSVPANTFSDTDRIQYWMSGGRIMKRVEGQTPLAITAEDVVISGMKFYVLGSAPSPGDVKQPKVIMIIQGYTGEGASRSYFNIETTISQRVIDS
jgi:prepilin-type N-terminal cleavage/methylation domain-containing protein